jgi:hypothetical protein
MKVSIYETVQVSDEQRVMLGAVLDGQVKPKRQATRDELKAFIWEHGSGWEADLANTHSGVFGGGDEPEPEEADEDEDLIGGDDDLEDLL